MVYHYLQYTKRSRLLSECSVDLSGAKAILAFYFNCNDVKLTFSVELLSKTQFYFDLSNWAIYITK